MTTVSLHTVISLQDRPRQLQRYLNAIITEGDLQQRLLAANLLAMYFWQKSQWQEAIVSLKKTLHLDPHSIEAIWAMRLLGFLYQRLGFKTERYEIDMRRLTSLRRMYHTSDIEAHVAFAYHELQREYDDRDLLSEFTEHHFRRVA